jgi:Zn-dependent peptidase ImmA (M78 family)
MTKTELIIRKEASKFRDSAGLSPVEPVNIQSLLLKINVLTVYKPLSESFSGMAVKNDGKLFILVNSNHPVGRQNFTVGHELCHLYVQNDFAPHACLVGHFDPSNKQEWHADMFSAELLMPEDGLLEIIPEDQLGKNQITIVTILKLEHIFEVSRLALLYRLKNMGLITETVLNTFKDNVKKSAIDYGFGTALYKPANENLIIGDYGSKAHLLFESGRISEGHFLELMNIFQNDEQNQA